MDYRLISNESGTVARVIFNRPRYRNALSKVLLEEIDDSFSHAMANDEVLVIVLSG